MNLDKLDKAFSNFIRSEGADDNGMVRCCTCGHPSPWQYMDNGHFIPRGNLGTRYHLKNCHVQCVPCNRNLSGNLKKYKEFLIQKYGPEIIEELEQESRKDVKLMQHEIDELTEYYKNKLK